MAHDTLTITSKYTRESISSLNFKFIFRIFFYSTASVGGKVYIIGGMPDENRISEYNDDQWSDYGSLFTGRHFHSSISFNSKTMILGAYSNSVPGTE